MYIVYVMISCWMILCDIEFIKWLFCLLSVFRDFMIFRRLIFWLVGIELSGVGFWFVFVLVREILFLLLLDLLSVKFVLLDRLFFWFGIFFWCDLFEYWKCLWFFVGRCKWGWKVVFVVFLIVQWMCSFVLDCLWVVLLFLVCLYIWYDRWMVCVL